MRTIGVVTTSRADYGTYRPLLHAIQDDPELSPHLFVSGMHLSAECGLTVRQIEADGFDIAERIENLLAADTPEAIGKSTGLGIIGFAQAFARWRPDLLVVVGDRFEMHAAVLAALPFKIPVAHLSGGADGRRYRRFVAAQHHQAESLTLCQYRRVRASDHPAWRGALACHCLRRTLP